MLRLVNLEVITGTAADQHHRPDQEQRKKWAVCFFGLGFGFRLGHFLHGFGGLRLRFGGHFLGWFLALFGKRQKVIHGYSVEEIDVFAGFLLVDHQIENTLVCGGNGVELFAVLVGGVVHHRSRSIRGKGVLGFRLRLGFHRGGGGLGLRLIALGVSRDRKDQATQKAGSHHRQPAKFSFLHGPCPPFRVPPASGHCGPKRQGCFWGRSERPSARRGSV